MKRFPILMAALLGTSSHGQAALVVVPNALAQVEGDTAQPTPFTGPDTPGPGGEFWNSMRYQQVYDASQFAAMAPGGEIILAIVFRIDSDLGEGFAAVLRNVQINLSTTQKSADGLSTNFQENVGPDEIVAFRGQLEFAGGISPFDRPQGFGTSIPSGWFFYRPSAGNLLLDIRVFTYSNSFPATWFDASSVAGDAISTIFSTNVNSTAGEFLSTRGLVTQFHTFPTPALSLTRTNGSLLFSWVDYPRGYRLETRDCLDCASPWQAVAELGTTNDYVREILLPLDTKALSRFYRLSWRPPPKAQAAKPPAGVPTRALAKNH